MKTARFIGLLSLALASLLLALPAQAARLALVIGNDAYRNLGANGVLKNAGNDARLMASTLTAAGFEVVGGVRTNLDRNGLWDALEKFKNRVGKTDEVVFFYAGHGVQIDAAQYMLPTDITPSSDDQVARDALPLYRVQDYLRGARFALLVVDACRDNPFPPKPGQRSIGQSRGLVPPTQAAEGSVVVLAADKNQTALDYVPGATSANGLFTHELVKALKTPGLDVVSAVKKARAQVLVSARGVNHAQKPTYVDEIAEGEFVLFASLVSVPVVPPPPPGPSAAQIEQEAWEQAKRGNSQGAYEAYLRGYPQGRYAQAAQVALAGFRPAQVASIKPEPVEPSPQPQPARPASATPPAGQVIKDCAECPEMVVIPAGSFEMGSNDKEDEKPIHKVNIKSFELGKYEVTKAQWKSVMGDDPDDRVTCGDNCPVSSVWWERIQGFIDKLNAKSGKSYRLPSEAEWEYAARAGRTTKYAWGDKIGKNMANCEKCGSKWGRNVAPVGQFHANDWGLHDMNGNVSEWVQDTYHSSYSGAPTDGSAWESVGKENGRVHRGGSYYNHYTDLRSTSRDRLSQGYYFYSGIGLRLARTLP
jgi:formylglycine-generating enzyme required for sulfatase activity